MNNQNTIIQKILLICTIMAIISLIFYSQTLTHEMNIKLITPESIKFNSYESQDLVNLTITNNEIIEQNIKLPNIILCVQDSNNTFLFSRKLYSYGTNIKKTIIRDHYITLPKKSISETIIYSSNFYSSKVYNNRIRGQDYTMKMYIVEKHSELIQIYKDDICLNPTKYETIQIG